MVCWDLIPSLLSAAGQPALRGLWGIIAKIHSWSSCPSCLSVVLTSPCAQKPLHLNPRPDLQPYHLERAWSLLNPRPGPTPHIYTHPQFLTLRYWGLLNPCLLLSPVQSLHEDLPQFTLCSARTSISCWGCCWVVHEAPTRLPMPGEIGHQPKWPWFFRLMRICTVAPRTLISEFFAPSYLHSPAPIFYLLQVLQYSTCYKSITCRNFLE